MKSRSLGRDRYSQEWRSHRGAGPGVWEGCLSRGRGPSWGPPRRPGAGGGWKPWEFQGVGLPSVSRASTGGVGQDKASRPQVSSSPTRTNVGSGEADGPGRSPKLLTCHQPCLCPSKPGTCLTQPCLLRPFLIQILLSFSLAQIRTSEGSLRTPCVPETGAVAECSGCVHRLHTLLSSPALSCHHLRRKAPVILEFLSIVLINVGPFL